VTTIKPVVSLIAGSALSCGYLIASASDYIIAPSCGDIGNIGVLQMIQRFENPKIASDIVAGLDMKVFQAGEFKTLTNPYSKKLSENDKKYIQDELNKVYKQFLLLVAHNRGLHVKNHKVWADGRIFIPSEAISLGLIDKIGTAFEAEEKLCELIRKKNPAQTYADSIETIFYGDSRKQALVQEGDAVTA
jgi:protease-4